MSKTNLNRSLFWRVLQCGFFMLLCLFGASGTAFARQTAAVYTVKLSGWTGASTAPATGGTTVTATVTLNRPAQAGGASFVVSSSTPSAASVPASVTIPENAATANFTVQTFAVAAQTQVTISVGSSTAARTATLIVDPAGPSSVTFNPSKASGGGGTTGTVTLSGPAPSGGMTVYLSRNYSGILSLPASVSVPAGETSAPFTVSVAPGAHSFTASIVAGCNNKTATGSLSIVPILSGVSVSRSSVVGGDSAVGTVLLATPAPAGGLAVALASSSGSATVPASVIVPAGESTTNFPIATAGVGASTTTTVTASAAQVTKTTTLTVLPAARVSSITLQPSSVFGTRPATGTVSLSSVAPDAGHTVRLSSDNTVARVPATVTIPPGTNTATFAVDTVLPNQDTVARITGADDNGGNASADLTVVSSALKRVYLQNNQGRMMQGSQATGVIEMNAPFPAAVTVFLASDKTTVLTVPRSVSVPANTTTVTFTLTAAAQVAQPTAVEIRASCGGYTRSTSVTVEPACSLETLSINSASVFGGQSATGTVTLTGKAPAGGAVVTLSSDHTEAATVPASVTVPAGSTTASFAVTTKAVAETVPTTITAQFGGVDRAGSLSVRSPEVNGISITAEVTGGANASGSVSLTSPAPVGGIAVTLTSGHQAVTVPATVTVSGGSSSASFTATTSSVPEEAVVAVTANVGADGVQKTASLRVKPGPVVKALAPLASSVVGGGTVSCTVTLTTAAPAGGVTVSLSSDSAALTVPASVAVAAGATSATFTASSTYTPTPVTATLTATLGQGAASATVTVSNVELSEVAFSPASVFGGQSATGTVTLTGKAPTGGAVVTLSRSDTAAANVATVPTSITVAAGATSATFTVTTTQPAASTAITVNAAYGGATRARSLFVNRVELSNFYVSPSPVMAGQSATGTILLSGPAPAGGVVVTLTSNTTAVASVPASMTVAAGSTSATFTVTTTSQTTSRLVTLQASAGGVTRSSPLLVEAIVVTSVSLAKTSVVGGNTVTGTVLLNQAPTSNTSVTLASSSTSATVPGSVSVAAGSTVATFTVTTTRPAQAVTALITATRNGVTRGAELTVTPVYVATLSVPASFVGGAKNGALRSGSVTLSDMAPPGGVVVTLANSNTAVSVPASITIPAGSAGGTFSITVPRVEQEVSATITADHGVTRSAELTVLPFILKSVNLGATQVRGGLPLSQANVRLNANAPTGGIVVELSADNPAVTVPPTVTFVANANSDPDSETVATFNVTTAEVETETAVTVTAKMGAQEKTAALTLFPTTVSAVSLASPTVVGGASVGGSVSLGGTAASPVVVHLASDNPAVTVPASVTVPAGQATASFTATTINPPATTAATITASRGGASKTVQLTVTVVAVSAVTLSSERVSGATTVSGTVTLDGSAPEGGAVVTLSSDHTEAATVPASVTVPAGSTTASFTVTTQAISETVTALISAQYGGVTRSDSLVVEPVSGLESVTLESGTVGGGTKVTGRVTLSTVAPPGGTMVTLASDNAGVASVPTGLQVPAGLKTATFQVTTSAVTADTQVTITGTLAGVTRTAILTVTPLGLMDIVIEPSAILGTWKAVGTVLLNGNAPAGGVTVQLASTQPSVLSVPASITIAAGSRTKTFDVTTTAVTTPTSVTVSGTALGQTKNAEAQVMPLQANSLALDSAGVVGGEPVQALVTLSGPAPVGGAAVALTVSNSDLLVAPAQILIPEGQKTGTVQIETRGVTVLTSVSAGIAYGGFEVTASLDLFAIPAPEGLKATALSSSEIYLDWEKALGATGYQIERSLSAQTGWSPVTQVSSGTSGYLDTGLQAQTTYYYRVNTLGHNVASPNSSVASATTDRAQITDGGEPQRYIPAASLLVAKAEDGRVELMWNMDPWASSYTIKRAIGSTAAPLAPIASGFVGTQFTDTAVANGTTYYYVVTGVNELGESPASNVASARPNPIDGTAPLGKLTFGADGLLYGATAQGGVFGSGTIFRVHPLSGDLSTLYAFPTLDAFGVNAQGAYPIGGLFLDGSNIYGTAARGGTAATGSLFRLTIPSGALPGSFAAQSLPSGDTDLTLGPDTYLYGVLNTGGANGTGAIFRMDSTGVVTLVYSFPGYTDPDTVSVGMRPADVLTVGNDGLLYGVTTAGGANGTGTVFRMATSGAITVLHSFDPLNDQGTNAEGRDVQGELVQASDGYLYGVAAEGGANDTGTIFRIQPGGIGFAVVHTFPAYGTANAGINPVGGLTVGIDGALYGVTTNGGSEEDAGTVFRLALDGTFLQLHAFNNEDGSHPIGRLTRGVDGTLYGTTSAGGEGGNGIIFRVGVGGTVQTIYHFSRK